MPLENIVVKGAREHNLKNIDVTIPRNKLVVIIPMFRDSGKSTLAFDTIYAEGQRQTEGTSSVCPEEIRRPKDVTPSAFRALPQQITELYDGALSELW
ncbi:MAG: hypothetical protein HYU30_05365 [Chloroflexi bacterium]|nr:hypothetical protein [Chloroflexota bacterium]